MEIATHRLQIRSFAEEDIPSYELAGSVECSTDS